jgi:hypothetical protein
MGAGVRTRLHNGLERDLYDLCGRALTGPMRQPSPWPQNIRPDLMCTGLQPGGASTPIDVAVTSIYARGHMAEAASSPGGAAAAYEATKKQHYTRALARADHGVVPFVIDIFGAMGPSAAGLVAKLSRLIAARFNTPYAQCLREVKQQLQTGHQRRLAQLLHYNAGERRADADATDLPTNN